MVMLQSVSKWARTISAQCHAALLGEKKHLASSACYTPTTLPSALRRLVERPCLSQGLLSLERDELCVFSQELRLESGSERGDILCGAPNKLECGGGTGETGGLNSSS